MNIGAYFRYIVHPRVELSSQIPTLCSDSRIAAWEHASQIAHWLLTAMTNRPERSHGSQPAIAWRNRSSTHTFLTHLSTFTGVKELPHEKKRQRYHAPRPQIPPVRLGNEILVGTFGITFTSSLSFKSVYQKYPPIVRFIFRDTPHDQVIDRERFHHRVAQLHASWPGSD